MIQHETHGRRGATSPPDLLSIFAERGRCGRDVRATAGSGAGAESAHRAGDAALGVDEGAAAVGAGAGAGDDEGADTNLATGHG